MDNEIIYTRIEDRNETPEWLLKLVENNNFKQITKELLQFKLIIEIRNILENSCFYYCAGSDITPIIALEKYIHSFIYCDNCLDQDGYEALFQLKKKLQNNCYNEIQKLNVDLSILPNFKNLEKYRDTKYLKIKRPKDELSIWEKDGHFYCIFYLFWDDICAFNNLYKKNMIHPIVICNIAPTNSQLGWYFCNDNKLPKYVIGYGFHINKLFKKIGQLKYFGDYGGPSTLWQI